MKFRKKAVVVEAFQWEGKNHRGMFNFLEGEGADERHISTEGNHFYINHSKVEGGLVIKTSEGDMLANIGDWIIKEPFDKERMFYPCKPDIFEKTYEQVEENE